MPTEKPTPDDRSGRLTDEERSVLDAAFAGDRPLTIAKKLRIGVRTAERLLADGISKLGARNLVEAARLVSAEASGTSAAFEAAFRASPGAMVIGSPDGRIVAANEAFCRLLGYSEAEILERSCEAMTHPADVAADIELKRRLRPGGAACRLAKRFLGRGGVAVWVDLVVVAAGGVAIGYVVPAPLVGSDAPVPEA